MLQYQDNVLTGFIVHMFLGYVWECKLPLVLISGFHSSKKACLSLLGGVTEHHSLTSLPLTAFWPIFLTVNMFPLPRKFVRGKKWSFASSERSRLASVFILSLLKGYSLNRFTPMSDQDRISPYNICTISSTQVMRIKKNIRGL